MVCYTNKEALEPVIGEMINLILMRLQHHKSNSLITNVTQFFSLVAALFGSSYLTSSINTIQTNLFDMILADIWIASLSIIGTFFCSHSVF